MINRLLKKVIICIRGNSRLLGKVFEMKYIDEKDKTLN